MPERAGAVEPGLRRDRRGGGESRRIVVFFLYAATLSAQLDRATRRLVVSRLPSGKPGAAGSLAEIGSFACFAWCVAVPPLAFPVATVPSFRLPAGIRQLQGGEARVLVPYAIAYRPPPDHLADRVSSFYEFTDPAPLHDDVERSDRQQLRLMLQGDGRYEFANGHHDPSPLVGLLGPTTGSVRGVSTGPTMVVGAGLWPAAWHAMAGQHADVWLDRMIDARTLFGDRAEALWRDVAAATDMEARFAVLADFITDVTEPADPEHLRFSRLVDSWLTGNTDPQIEQLLAATGYNQRKLERMTRHYYGLTPKTLSRKYRALRAAAAMVRGEDIDEAGLADGFYDQSHLIREVKRFAGLTPQRLKARESRLLTEIAEGRVGLRGAVSALVSES